MTEKYTLTKEPINPDDWEMNGYYFVHKETGETITDETYYGRKKEREILEEYLEEL